MISQAQRSVNLETTRLIVHSIYGAIYEHGEFVQRGAILGLSVDTREVVVAPISGWLNVIGVEEHEPIALQIEIGERQLDPVS